MVDLYGSIRLADGGRRDAFKPHRSRPRKRKMRLQPGLAEPPLAPELRSGQAVFVYNIPPPGPESAVLPVHCVNPPGGSRLHWLPLARFPEPMRDRSCWRPFRSGPPLLPAEDRPSRPQAEHPANNCCRSGRNSDGKTAFAELAVLQLLYPEATPRRVAFPFPGSPATGLRR